MLAVLFGNVFAPLIDWFVVSMNIRRRMARYAASLTKPFAPFRSPAALCVACSLARERRSRSVSSKSKQEANKTLDPPEEYPGRRWASPPESSAVPQRT